MYQINANKRFSFCEVSQYEILKQIKNLDTGKTMLAVFQPYPNKIVKAKLLFLSNFFP